MESILCCPHAIQVGRVVRCNFVDSLHEADLNLIQLDFAIQPNSLAIAGGGRKIHCGLEGPEQRKSCIGSHVPQDRLKRLFAEVRDKNVLMHVEHGVTRARIFDAAADSFFDKSLS